MPVFNKDRPFCPMHEYLDLRLRCIGRNNWEAHWICKCGYEMTEKEGEGD